MNESTVDTPTTESCGGPNQSYLCMTGTQTGEAVVGVVVIVALVVGVLIFLNKTRTAAMTEEPVQQVNMQRPLPEK